MTDSNQLYALTNVVQRCWTEAAFKDVTLESSDGVKVPATRVVLAARSEVFQAKLLGENSSEATVKIDLSGAVLEAVVEFCYTDNASVLDWKAKAAAGPDPNFIPTLFGLQTAAAEFKLPGLSATIGDCVTSYLDQFPTLCYGAYQAWKNTGPAASTSSNLGGILLSRVRSSPMEGLKASSLVSLTSATTKELLEDKKMEATELELFQFLQKWMEAGPGRKNDAMDMVELIKLHDIAPTVLSTDVASSGLVTPDQLMEAYKNQALAAASQQPVKFERRRFSVAPMWSKTMSDMSSPAKSNQSWKADTLEFPPMSSGKYKWALEFAHVDADEIGFAWLGISSSAVPFKSNTPLDEQNGCWAVNDRCRGVHEGGTAFADFEHDLGEGHTITFTLDLSPDQEERGTLSVQVDGNGPSRSLGKFENLLDHLEENPGAGFVPAMAQRDVCVIKALGIPTALE
ncbi:BACK [Seminavis robusta]|uniref:BACK n=1 Tax=Seminavis robusta TaxID=568900 RepID=A0A9N8EIT0_9STRA|nr:BACK [Seminavis robusta]|eukprot:Sro1003_g229970.1 BACK (457) ;mRNA; f:6156-7526